nr:MAG TPA: Helix-turn-helix XRE-family like protein [Caudoviricetes sp.]
MLTIDQKVEMYRMRLEGKSYQAIADRFGVSRQYVYQLFGQKYKSEPYRNVNVRYTGLRKWMNESNYSVAKLARESGCTDNHSYATITSYLQGSPFMSIDFIRKILGFTGLTFEEAFGEAEQEDVRDA